MAAPPVITSPLFAQAFVGQEFVYKLVVSGAEPGSLSADSLPAGLMFDPSLSAITGEPTESGQFQIHLSAANAIGTTDQNVTLTIDPAVPITIINTTGATGGIRGQLFTYQVRATGVTTLATVNATGLPTGLTMDNSDDSSGIVPMILTVDETLDLVSAAPCAGRKLTCYHKSERREKHCNRGDALQLNFTSNSMIPVINSPTGNHRHPG